MNYAEKAGLCFYIFGIVWFSHSIGPEAESGNVGWAVVALLLGAIIFLFPWGASHRE